MRWARYDKIIAFKTDQGHVVGFHNHNMQVAELDELVWKTLTSSSHLDPATEEAKSEILQWNHEIDPAAKDLDIKSGIRSLSVNIAQICNLKCTYCAAGGDGTFRDPVKSADLEKLQDQIRMFLHDVTPGDEFSITFFGGEPMLVPDAIRNLARFAKLQVAGRNIKLRFFITTNGTLITPENAELLASINANVIVSLDGTSEINDKSRPTRSGKSSTAQTLKGIENLMRVRDRLGYLHVGSVFGRHYTGVLETYRFLRQFDFDSIKFDFAAEADDAEASFKYTEELLKTADLAFELGGEKELRKLHMFDIYFRALDQRKRIQNHCGAGKSHLQIDARGKFSICQWFVNDPAEEVGHDLKLDHSKLSHYQQRLTDLNDQDRTNCNKCWAKNLCGGGCMWVNKTKTGSKHQVDNEFCDRTRNTIAKAIQLYAEARAEKREGDGSEVH